MIGFGLVDKPGGMTSFDVVARVRRATRERRVGHTGTLDPMATGLLVVAVGEATKLIPLFDDDDKTYEAEMALGVATDTEDVDGRVVEERPVPALTRAVVDEVAARFRGTISQVPPMVSALKRDGRRLYELAREGVTVAREPRSVVVHELVVTDVTLPRIRMRARVSKGTYVRTLAVDMARALGTVAHLTALRRTRAGETGVDRATPLVEFEKAPRLIAPRDLLGLHPKAVLSASEIEAARHGREIRWTTTSAQGGVSRIVLVSREGDVIGLASVSPGGTLRPCRILRSE